MNMVYNSVYIALVSLALSVAARHLTMQAKQVFDSLGHKEFGSYYEGDFSADPVPTLHDLMYKGKDPEDWKVAATEVGVFLAKVHESAKGDRVNYSSGFNSSSALQDWLNQLSPSNDDFVKIFPDRIRQAYSGDVEHLRKRVAEAEKLLQKKEYVSLQNVLTRNIKLKNSQIRFDGKNIHARLGPNALDAALFLSDVLLMYYKQTGQLEHGVQWKTVETAQKFGQALDEGIERLGASEDERKQFWADVSLLTGWEIVRRFSTKEDVLEILSREEHDPASVTESGLRLINNERIKNPNFLVMVALALL